VNGRAVSADTDATSPEAISAVETVLDFERDTVEEGATHSLVFASFREPFAWDLPTLRTGVPYATVSVSDAYAGDGAAFPHHVKIGAYVAGTPWLMLTAGEYAAEKRAKERELLARLKEVFPALRPDRARAIESLTPATVVRYTRHAAGGIYGASAKNFRGTTATRGLFLCGNDQGGIGIVGAAISGVVMANVVLLERPA
jgi:phytoene dehydrogenase-like protein